MLLTASAPLLKYDDVTMGLDCQRLMFPIFIMAKKQHLLRMKSLLIELHVPMRDKHSCE